MTGLVVVNDYALLAGPEAFAVAIGALARRVEREGERGVLRYQFFAGNAGTGRGIIHYAGAGAWVGHHEIAFGWPEMKALHEVARLVQVAFHGEVTEGMRDWMARAGLVVPVVEYGDYAGGFVRGV